MPFSWKSETPSCNLNNYILQAWTQNVIRSYHAVNEDYNGVMRVLNFSEDGYWEVMIPIFDNSPVEVSEFFRARLSTASPFVVFNNDVSTIIIIDNDSTYLL